MISIGRGIRWYNNYLNEVDFCIKNDFDFMQLWFKDGELLVDNVPEPKESYIKKIGFPVIIHAVFELEDFKKYGNKLLDLSEYLGMNEVIIHPVSETVTVNQNTAYLLAEQSLSFSEKSKKRNIVWYLENNSVVDVFHCKKQDIEIVYQTDSYVEQLLDIAHIDSYKHLEEIISVKYPKCLHVAGKHFNVPHEHLPLVQGDIDYSFVFENYLKEYKGRIILEIDADDNELLLSKKIIENAISKCISNDRQ